MKIAEQFAASKPNELNYSRFIQWQDIVLSFAEMFELGSKKFDRKKFLDACKY
jgi:hypothetical protein